MEEAEELQNVFLRDKNYLSITGSVLDSLLSSGDTEMTKTPVSVHRGKDMPAEPGVRNTCLKVEIYRIYCTHPTQSDSSSRWVFLQSQEDGFP